MKDPDPQRGAATAKAIEKAHLTLQEKHKNYRRVQNQAGDETSGASPELIELQGYVVTFFELLRPYLAKTPGLREYWHGGLAEHPETPHDTVSEGVDYYRNNSVGVWRVSSPEVIPVPHPQKALAEPSAPTEAVADGSGIPETLHDWHDALSLPAMARVFGVEPETDEFQGYDVRALEFGVVGLREIDRWSVTRRRVREPGSGFMAGETAEREVIDTEPPQKILTAKRMLVEAAEELDALADLDTADHREAEYDYSDLI